MAPAVRQIARAAQVGPSLRSGFWVKRDALHISSRARRGGGARTMFRRLQRYAAGITVAALAAAFSATGARAQEPNPVAQALTLSEAVNVALQGNPARWSGSIQGALL